MENAGPLIVPSDIPWPQYVGEALEELLYWLCDALGAKELEWRAGSSHGTSRDRGRDLEATFHVPMADAEVHAQRWWIQAKGRSGTVSPSVVREAVVEVLAHKGVDVLVVATNSRFSNDTRDWVAEFQESHPRPLIRLWDRDTLERMLVGTPSVVARVAPGALSLAGRLEAVAASFWDKQQLPTTGLLDEFWSQRAELTFDPRALLAVVVGDAAAGHLPLHPWGAEVDAEPLIECVAFALANFAPLLFRFERAWTTKRLWRGSRTCSLAP